MYFSTFSLSTNHSALKFDRSVHLKVASQILYGAEVDFFEVVTCHLKPTTKKNKKQKTDNSKMIKTVELRARYQMQKVENTGDVWIHFGTEN